MQHSSKGDDSERINQQPQVNRRQIGLSGAPSTESLISSVKKFLDNKVASNAKLLFLPANEKVLSFHRSEEKASFIASIESLTKWALTCLKLNTGDNRYNAEKVSYRRGCIECINFIIRATLSVGDISLLKIALKLLASVYAYFNELKLAVQAYERLRDVSAEDRDFIMVMFA